MRGDETRNGWDPRVFPDKGIGVDVNRIASTFEDKILGFANIVPNPRGNWRIGMIVNKDGISKLGKGKESDPDIITRSGKIAGKLRQQSTVSIIHPSET